MDGKGAFMNSYIQEDVYHPPCFKDFLSYIFKMKKAFHDIKLALRDWFDSRRNFLLENMFLRRKDDNSFSSLVYFFLCKELSEMVQNEFEMSMMWELRYFIGLQIHQTKEATFINQAKYYKELLKRFDIEKSKVIETPLST